jgi:hypothetical protein
VGIPVLISDFSSDGLSRSPFSIMLPVGLSYTVFIMLRNILSIPTFFRAFIMKGY